MACSSGPTDVLQLHPRPADQVDKVLFARLRSLADFIVVDAGTMRAEGYGPARLGPLTLAHVAEEDGFLFRRQRCP